ncbi:MAG: DUF2683 family protein [Candidatus Micrarchaeota archaeon]
MVYAVVNISEKANRVLNIVKAKYGLKDKSGAIDVVVEEYAEEILEPSLRPEYIVKALAIGKQKAVVVGGIKNLRARYEK